MPKINRLLDTSKQSCLTNMGKSVIQVISRPNIGLHRLMIHAWLRISKHYNKGTNISGLEVEMNDL